MYKGLARMTIRGIDERCKQWPRTRVAQHERSTDGEAREILFLAPSCDLAQGPSLFYSIRARIGPLGGIELDFLLLE